MLDLSRTSCLGEALRDCLVAWRGETCLIEADRDRENLRLTYGEFARRAETLAQWLEENGLEAGARAAIVMSNQSKWLLSAYAVFFAGGVLVPLDFKLAGPEIAALLAHSSAEVLITEHHLWRGIAPALQGLPRRPRLVLVTDAPGPKSLPAAAAPDTPLLGAARWEDCTAAGQPHFVRRQREDIACIVYSSGTAGRPKGCMLTHGNYLAQCQILTSLYKFGPGIRYLSILPTNHAIDFMVGFIGPFLCGATVVHLRTLRPEFVREAFGRYRIAYMALVPMILSNLERGLRARLEAQKPARRWLVERLISLNRGLTHDRPRVGLSRILLGPIHRAFGGRLRVFFVGGAFAEPSTLQFFYDLGIPVVNGYGLTEAGTAVTLNDLRPFRADTVGRPLPGTEVRILDPDAEGIGEVAVRGPTVMAGYLDDPELTGETIRDGWLLTGDLGRVDPTGHLQLFGRRKNMIVTAGGKNIYPEDIENAFAGLQVKEYCAFSSNYLWPGLALNAERLVMVLRLEPGQELSAELRREVEARNRRLPDFKRIHGLLVAKEDFPRTASMKVKRTELASRIRAAHDPDEALVALQTSSRSAEGTRSLAEAGGRSS